jgi:hypothetical protein
MSWASYEPYVGSGSFGNGMSEPIQSMKPEAPSSYNQFQTPSAPPMTAHQATAPPKQYPPGSKNVPVPPPSQEGSKWKDISDYYEVSDWVFLGIAVLLVDVLVLFLIRFFPDVFGKAINIWYNRFKLSAVISDVFIILLGFGIARYIYTEYIYPKYDWNPIYFTGLSVVVQVIHDILFYFGVIKPITPGHNAMMDVFKTYSESGGAKVIAADSAMMIASSFFSMALKAAPAHITAFIGLLTFYVVPYILETRNEFSGVA